MDKIKNIIAYICLKYPNRDELSNARLTKLVYLADWTSALANGEQMTDIKWVFNHYGPYVSDIITTARRDSKFDIISSTSLYGGKKEIISFNGDETDVTLSDKEKKILDFIINKTYQMYFNELIDYVYSTYPVSAKERYSYLALNELAAEYKKNMNND